MEGMLCRIYVTANAKVDHYSLILSAQEMLHVLVVFPNCRNRLDVDKISASKKRIIRCIKLSDYKTNDSDIDLLM